jgi:hypothetical protein
MEPIARRAFSSSELAAIQDRAIVAVEAEPEKFIARYVADKRSRAGRYVCADLFKETFDDYRRDRLSRYVANHPVHNASAVLASEQLRRVLVEPKTDAFDPTAVFLTGVPGAGKTTTVDVAGDQVATGKPVVLPPHAIYEGQLSRPDPALPKIQAALDAGLAVVIAVVHPEPEAALLRTLQRCDAIGRGAPIEVMADIQGRLPEGLAAIHSQFGDAVALRVVDSRGTIRQAHDGWQHLKILESEGSRETIYERLDRTLELWHRQGAVSESAYAQARGYEAAAEHSFVAGSSIGSRESARHQSGDARASQGAQFLSDAYDHASAFAQASKNPLVRAFLEASDSASRHRAAIEYPALIAAFAHDAAARAFGRERLGNTAAADAFHIRFREQIAIALHEGRAMPAPPLRGGGDATQGRER